MQLTLRLTCLLAAAGMAQAQTPTETVIYSFSTFPNGAKPYAPLVRDAEGNLLWHHQPGRAGRRGSRRGHDGRDFGLGLGRRSESAWGSAPLEWPVSRHWLKLMPHRERGWKPRAGSSVAPLPLNHLAG